MVCNEHYNKLKSYIYIGVCECETRNLLFHNYFILCQKHIKCVFAVLATYNENTVSQAYLKKKTTGFLKLKLLLFFKKSFGSIERYFVFPMFNKFSVHILY